jgi:hypothetical protein
MAIKLIVTEPFGGYHKGQEITDQKTVQAILEGSNAAHVVQVQAPEAPASTKTTK